MGDARDSKLKIFLNQMKEEIISKLYLEQKSMDDITKAELNGRLSMIKEIEHVCEQRGRY